MRDLLAGVRGAAVYEKGLAVRKFDELGVALANVDKVRLERPRRLGYGLLGKRRLEESTSLASMCWDMKEAALSMAASMSASLMAERSLAA